MALRISKQLPSGWPLINPCSHVAFLSNFTSSWPQLTCKTIDLINALHSGLGSFLPNLVATGHFWGMWPLFDPSWPLHDLWPQQCITFWSGVLPTKFGGHRALLSKLTPTWPLITPSWPLTPAMHYTLVRDSSNQIWWPWGISKQFDPGWPQMTPAWPLTPAMHYALVRGSSHKIWWL